MKPKKKRYAHRSRHAKHRQSASLSRKELRTFYANNNVIALLLLLYIIVLIVSASKILDRLAIYETQDPHSLRTYDPTGSATDSATVTLTIEAAAEESAADGNVSGGSPGGRGRALRGLPRDAKGIDIDFVPDTLSISLLHKETARRSLKIVNTGHITLDFVATATFGSSFLTISPASFSVRPGDQITLSLEFTGDTVGAHAGLITVTGFGVTGFVPVILDVNSPNTLGTVDLLLDETFAYMAPGKDIHARLSLQNFPDGTVDILTFIKDTTNTIVAQDTLTKSIQGDLLLDKTLHIPSTALPGLYIVGVEVHQQDATAVDSDFFTVLSSTSPTKEQPTFIVSRKTFRTLALTIILLLLLAYLLYLREIMRSKKMRKHYAREHQRDKKVNY